jgi:hypothetical protein
MMMRLMGISIGGMIDTANNKTGSVKTGLVYSRYKINEYELHD